MISSTLKIDLLPDLWSQMFMQKRIEQRPQSSIGLACLKAHSSHLGERGLKD
jgi:hypothetical protein